MMTGRSHSDRCPTCHRKHKRNSEQNRRLWALYHMAADKLHPDGHTFSAETWHTYYKSRFLGCDEVKLPSQKVLLIPRSTADLDVAEFSDYMTKVEADLNERGVFLEDGMFA